MKFVTQTDIASELGISRSAVAKAFHSKLRTQLNPQRCQTILATAKRLGYRPQRQAQAVRRGRSATIALVQFSGFLHVNDLRAMLAAQAIHASGYHLLTSHLLWTRQGIEEALSSMLESRVEGVLLVGPTERASQEFFDQIRAAGVPMVSLSGVHFTGVPQVRADVHQAAFDLTRHLLGCGHRRLTLLTQWASRFRDEAHCWPWWEREAGMRDAVAAAGDAGLMAETAGEESGTELATTYANGQQFMARLLARTECPRAVICTNDSIAVGALAACRQAGVRVPEEVAVAGFDNDPVGEFTSPPLTTVEQPTEAMTKRAVEILLKQIRGEKLSASEELVKMRCRIVVRESCGAKVNSKTLP